MIIIQHDQNTENQQNHTTENHEQSIENPHGFNKGVHTLMPKMINSSSEHDRRDARNRKINKKGQTKYKSKYFHGSISFPTR